MNASLRALALAAALLGPTAVRSAEPTQAPALLPTARDLSPRLDAVETGLLDTEESLHFVETQFT